MRESPPMNLMELLSSQGSAPSGNKSGMDQLTWGWSSVRVIQINSKRG